MGWSVRAMMSGDTMLGYNYKSTGGPFDADYCAALQQQQASQQINTPGKPYATPYLCDELITELADSETGFIYPSSYESLTTHMKGQCVSLVRGSVPGLDTRTKNWCRGDDLTSLTVGSLIPGIAIGYGWAQDGSYPSNAHGNHVAIFVSAANDGSRIEIIDQWHHSGSASQPATFQKPHRHSVTLSSKAWAIVTLGKVPF